MSVLFVRMYPSNWRSGCLGMTLEQEGLYCRICMFQAETGRRLPLDDTQAARMLNVPTKLYRRVLGSLIMLGKIKRHDDGYGNARAEREHEKASSAKHPAAPEDGADRQADPGQERQADAAPVSTNAVTSELQVSCNAGVTQFADEIPEQNQRQRETPLEIRDKKERNKPDADEARARTTQLLDGLQAKLEAAAGDQLENYARSPGLMNLSTPLMWLEQGCDLERDVLPAIRVVSARRKAKGKISDWNYFTQAIANAKRDRERGLPPPSEIAAPSRQTKGGVWEALQRRKALQEASHAA